MNHTELSDKALLTAISQADPDVVDQILQTTRKRYQQLHPDFELLIAVIPKKNPTERAALWRWLVAYIKHYEE